MGTPRDKIIEHAHQRLTDMVDESLDVLHEIMVNGNSDKNRLMAAMAVLDRIGVNSKAKVEVEISQSSAVVDAELDAVVTKVLKNKKHELGTGTETNDSVQTEDTEDSA